MDVKRSHFLNNAVFFFFALFLFSASLSIALSQFSFAISLFFFIILCFVTRYNPFACRLLCVYSAIALYLVWMIVSTLVNGASLANIKEEWLFLIIPVGLFLFKQQKFRGMLITMLVSGVILVSIYGIMQHYTGVNWLKDYTPVAAQDGTFYAPGGFRHNLTYGNYLAVASQFLIALALLRTKKKLNALNWITLFGGFMGLVGTVMSYSRTAVAALPIGLLALATLKGKRWVMISAALLILAATLTLFFVGELAFKYEWAFKRELTGEHESSRLFIWKKSIEIIKEHPIFGVGQGNFETAYATYLDPDKKEIKSRAHAHNDLLNFGAIAGIPGALLFILIWAVVFYRLHQIWHKSEAFSDRKIFAGAAAVAGLTFILTSLTEATFADEEIRQLLMVVWSAGLWPMMAHSCETEPTQK